MENNTFPKVAVGVCTYNRSNDLKRLLNSLKKLNYPNFEIIVVDNNSNDDTEKVANLIKAINGLKKDLDIPLSIKEYGVAEKDFMAKLDDIVEQAFNDQCTGANPVYPLMKELKQIYLDAYNGVY